MGGEAAGAGGEERPTRSFANDDWRLSGANDDCRLSGWIVGEAKLVKPWSKPLDDTDVVRDWGLGGAVGDVILSNKLPPLAEAVGEEILGAAGGDFLVAKLVRLAKGDGFSAGFGGGEVVDGKLSPLNASVSPPMFDDDGCGGGGEAISPKEGLRSCCGGAGGGFAYRDRIDCFRSGRDIPGALVGVEAVLAGRLAVGGLVSPKKSSPSNESPGLFGFGAAGG